MKSRKKLEKYQELIEKIIIKNNLFFVIQLMFIDF